MVLQLLHVPSWQLRLATETAGEIVGAMAWASSKRVYAVLKKIKENVHPSELLKVAQQTAVFRTDRKCIEPNCRE